MARNVGLFEGICEARTIGGIIAAESASLIDANYPVANAIQCRGFETLLVGVEIVAGASPTATIEAIFRDADAADGQRWKRLLLGAPDGITAIAAFASEDTGALATGASLVPIRVYGHPMVYLRVKAVTNATSTTSMKILVMGGKRR